MHSKAQRQCMWTFHLSQVYYEYAWHSVCLNSNRDIKKIDTIYILLGTRRHHWFEVVSIHHQMILFSFLAFKPTYFLINLFKPLLFWFSHHKQHAFIVVFHHGEFIHSVSWQYWFFLHLKTKQQFSTQLLYRNYTRKCHMVIKLWGSYRHFLRNEKSR